MLFRGVGRSFASEVAFIGGYCVWGGGDECLLSERLPLFFVICLV